VKLVFKVFAPILRR